MAHSQVPDRGIAARTEFKVIDLNATNAAIERAKSQARHVYALDSQPLVQLRAKCKADVVDLLQAEEYDKQQEETWNEFLVAIWRRASGA